MTPPGAEAAFRGHAQRPGRSPPIAAPPLLRSASRRPAGRGVSRGQTRVLHCRVPDLPGIGALKPAEGAKEPQAGAQGQHLPAHKGESCQAQRADGREGPGQPQEQLAGRGSGCGGAGVTHKRRGQSAC